MRHRLGRFEPAVAAAYRGLFVDLDALAGALASLAPAESIVEVGCGEGALAAALVRAFPAADYVGVDPSAHAGRLYDGDPARATFVSGTAGSFRGRSFDLCVVADVLHHVPVDQRSTVLADAAALVRPGGMLAVKDWERRRDVATLASTVADRYVTGDRHVRYFTLDELRRLVEDASPDSDTILERRVPPRRNNVLIVRRKR